MSDEEPNSAYAHEIGDRLRSIRRQQHLSLQAVEERSDREFKASVLGAYERGERLMSVLRLHRLAMFYRIPLDQLLPPTETVGIDGQRGSQASGRHAAGGPVRIDLSRLEQLEAPEQELLRSYVWMIQVQRGDFNGWVITIRTEDVIALGRVLSRDETSMRERIDELGLRLEL